MITDPSKPQLENIYAATADITFGKAVAAKIVGGRTRLTQLIASGDINADKPNAAAKNGKWSCNAAQVLAHARYSK